MDSSDLEKIWKMVLDEIEVELGKNIFGIHFRKSILLSLDKGVAHLGFPNLAVANQTSVRYYRLIQNGLQKAAKLDFVTLIFEVLPEQPLTSNNIGPLFTKEEDTTQKDSSDYEMAVKRCRLKSDFTLEEFCVSTSNQLAYAAVSAVVRTPGKIYNPLFLWGGVGVGKTHLMQAVGHEILKKNPKARIVYAPGEQFTNEIITAIRQKSTAEFKQRYRNAEALLIDDIQFFSGKDTAQEEFFHTFNHLQQNDGQIVMTSDRKPADIPDLADRLRSRFEGGMVADISTPDSELKTAICLAKAKKRGIELSNESAFTIASNVDNIRSLEGNLQQIISRAQLEKKTITPELVREFLGKPATNQPATPKIEARTILDTVCAYYEMPIKLIRSEKRDKPIATARQIIMYLLRKNTKMTLTEVADFLGGRDHTTIIHGANKIGALLVQDQRTKNEITELEKRLGVAS